MKNLRILSWLDNWALITAFAIIKLLIHFLTNTIYEIHRDGFLYIELGKHLDWGYFSVPPSIAVFADISRFIFGNTDFGIRFFPAIIGGASIIIIGLMVKEMGGGKMAQFLALLAFLTSPAFLRSNTLFQPVSFNQFYWLLLSFLIFRLIRTERPVYWIWIGIVAGLAFLNKYSVVFYLAAFFVSIFITGLRRWLKTIYPYLSGLIALLVALPNLIWQHQHDWPVVNHMRELAETQLIHVTLNNFLLEQVLMNLPALLIWVPGLVFVLFTREGKNFRIFGLIYVFVLLQLIILRGKHYYTLGLYTMLFAFGGYILVKWLHGKYQFIRFIIIGLNIILALFILPISLPVMKPDKYVRFMSNIGMEQNQRWEDGVYHDLPQDYADMIGWKELTEIVRNAYESLTPEEQQHCTIFANNYGEAGAINFYGKKYGLPHVISFNDSYLYWAPDSIPFGHLIKVGESDDLFEMYNDVRIFGRISTPYAREYGVPVYLFKDPKTDVNKYYQEHLYQERNN
ncbi:MAG: hypothetical protein AMS27_16030 [Bacteroides sp. SM23_62_1]|nr:MAG: hypothetical protein AMS27_16030 [Bacteroides sp. SM23_62_1]